jgi:hypothetical protein
LGVHVVQSDDAGKDEVDKRIQEDAGSHSPSLSSPTVPRSEPKDGVACKIRTALDGSR